MPLLRSCQRVIVDGEFTSGGADQPEREPLSIQSLAAQVHFVQVLTSQANQFTSDLTKSGELVAPIWVAPFWWHHFGGPHLGGTILVAPLYITDDKTDLTSQTVTHSIKTFPFT